MFDIPDAKRVRRADLQSHSRSRSPSPVTDSKPDTEIQKALQARLSALYGPLDPLLEPQSTNQDQPEPQEAQEQENEFEFRLFSSAPTSSNQPTNPNPTIQKILLHDEETEHDEFSEGRFLRPRPRTYYFHAPATGELKSQYLFSAIPGEEVVSLSKKRAWGLECPWRVKRIIVRSSPGKKSPVSQSSENLGVGEEEEEDREKEKRTKPNKKRRIILRERERVKRAKMEEKKRLETEKEEKEREKRTRRNREKKVKRKMKEKAKKAGGDGGGEVEITAGEVVGSGRDIEMGGEED